MNAAISSWRAWMNSIRLPPFFSARLRAPNTPLIPSPGYPKMMRTPQACSRSTIKSPTVFDMLDPAFSGGVGRKRCAHPAARPCRAQVTGARRAGCVSPCQLFLEVELLECQVRGGVEGPASVRGHGLGVMFLIFHPGIHPHFEEVQWQHATIENLVVESADFEAVAELLLSPGPQFANLELT